MITACILRDGIAFGRCKGCFFSLTRDDIYWRFRIYIGSAALLENAWNAADSIYMMNQAKEPDSFEPAFLPCGAVVPMHAACAESVREVSEKALQSHRERQRQNQRRQRNEFIVLLLIYLIVLLMISKK